MPSRTMYAIVSAPMRFTTAFIPFKLPNPSSPIFATNHRSPANHGVEVVLIDVSVIAQYNPNNPASPKELSPIPGPEILSVVRLLFIECGDRNLLDIHC